MLLRLHRPRFAFALWLLVAPFALARGDDAVRCDRRLPGDVSLYASCRSADEFRARWGQTALTKLVESEAFADVRRAAIDWEAEFSNEFRRQWGLGLGELLEIPEGEMAVGLTVLNPAGGAGIELQGVVMIDFGSKQDEVRELLDKLAGWAEDAGNSTRFEEEVDDVTLTLFRPEPLEEEAAPGVRPRDPYGYFLRDSFLVLGTDAESLKKVLSRWDGASGDVLAENEVYRYVVERCCDEQLESAPLIAWYVDPARLVQVALTAQAQQGRGMLGLAAGLMPVLGINGLRGAGGTFEMAQGDYDMVTRSLVYLEQPARGVLSLLQFDAVSQNPPHWVTAESDSYFTVRWNVDKAYEGVEKVADTLLGPGGLARYLQKASQDPQWGHIHVKSDVIDQLTGTFHFVSEPANDLDEEFGARYLVAAELKDAAAGRATLRKLAAFPGWEMAEREFQGETIYEIETGGDEDDAPATAMGLAIAEGHLMYASDVKLLERILRGTEGQLALSETERYQRVARRFPEKTFQISFSREDDDLKSILAMLQSGALNWLLGENADAVLSRLPAFETLKKSLPAAGGFMQTDDRGLKFTGFSLKTEAE